MKSNFGWSKDPSQPEKSEKPAVPAPKDWEAVADHICESALKDAKAQLHPLLRETSLDLLNQRDEFIQAFKLALEKRIARRLALLQPVVQAVFMFDRTRIDTIKNWDGSIHLLVKVPRLSNTLKAMGKILDHNLVKYFRQLGWSRFHKRSSILDVQQVTPQELRHGVSYGAMFSAAYSGPVKVWPKKPVTHPTK